MALRANRGARVHWNHAIVTKHRAVWPLDQGRNGALRCPAGKTPGIGSSKKASLFRNCLGSAQTRRSAQSNWRKKRRRGQSGASVARQPARRTLPGNQFGMFLLLFSLVCLRCHHHRGCHHEARRGHRGTASTAGRVAKHTTAWAAGHGAGAVPERAARPDRGPNRGGVLGRRENNIGTALAPGEPGVTISIE